MAIQQFNEKLNIIEQLSDFPGSEDGLTPQEFKKKFDLAGILIKEYINTVLIPAIENTTPGLYGLTMDLVKVILKAKYWSENQQTVQVEKVQANTSLQAIVATADAASMDTYLDCNVRLNGQGAGTLTFTCEDIPPTSITVNLLILTKGG